MKTSKVFIFSLALFGTLIIGGPALSPALSHGGVVAQAADTTTTVPTTVHLTAMPGAPSSPYAAPVSYTNNQTTMQAIMDAVEKNTQPNFSPILNIQLINDIANNICTPQQAEQIYSQYMSRYPAPLDRTADEFDMLAGAFGNNVIDQELLQERLAATVPYDGTSKTVSVDLEVPIRAADAHMTITYRTSDGTALPTAPFYGYWGHRIWSNGN